MQKNIVQENISLRSYNTFGVNYRAKFFVDVLDHATLQTILTGIQWKKEPKLILGDGSNILLTHDFNGLVIHNKIPGITLHHENTDHVWIQVGAGENWHQLVLHCIQNNYAGVENLSLIPGTVGAAPIQNIGAYGIELKETLDEIHTISIDGKQHQIFKNADCQFGYRDSIFKNELKNQYVITQVTLRLNKKPRFHIEYGAIRDTLQKMNIQNLSIKAMSDAIVHIRQEKLPDPKKIGNAGSFFKNPMVSQTILSSLQKQFPTMPFFMEKNQLVKIPAAWLIEQCGWKGKRFDHVGVHEKQALVLINDGNGTGQELKKLGEAIQASVFEKFGIALKTEVNIY